jgi:hypothetical protein
MGWRESERRLDDTLFESHDSSRGLPAPGRTRRAGGCLRSVGVVAVAVLGLLVVLALIGTSTRRPTSAISAAPPLSQAEATTGQTVYGTGQAAHTGDLNVMLVEVLDPFTPGSSFEQGLAHGRLVAAHFAIVNTARTERVLATFFDAQVTDAQNHTWRQSFAGSDLPRLDGNLEPGATRDGWIVFDVGQDATGLQLRMKGDITSVGSVFQLSP